jgi:3-isopropylmalate/(R)-2-methylmalate dehydratase large subunit
VSVPQTIAQKILAAHGVADISPGGFGLARVDLVMTNDVSGSVALREFERIGASRVFDPARVALFADHFAPAKDARSAALIARLREFARAQGIDQYWEVGSTPNGGIEHTVLAEEGLIAPGDLIAGGDSHSCTYGAFGAFGTGVGSTDIATALALGELWVRVPSSISIAYEGVRDEHVTGKDLILAYLARAGVAGGTYAALEFTGPVIDQTSIDERMALCNMAVEAGAKTGIVAADATTLGWLDGRVTTRPLHPVVPDAGADYAQEVTSTSPECGRLWPGRRRRRMSCLLTRSCPSASTRSTSATARTGR